MSATTIRSRRGMAHSPLGYPTMLSWTCSCTHMTGVCAIHRDSRESYDGHIRVAASRPAPCTTAVHYYLLGLYLALVTGYEPREHPSNLLID